MQEVDSNRPSDVFPRHSPSHTLSDWTLLQMYGFDLRRQHWVGHDMCQVSTKVSHKHELIQITFD